MTFFYITLKHNSLGFSLEFTYFVSVNVGL